MFYMHIHYHLTLSVPEATYALQARATGNYCPQEVTHLAFKDGDIIMVRGLVNFAMTKITCIMIFM